MHCRLRATACYIKSIVIPQAVYDEVVVYGAGDPGSDEISAAQWIRTLQARDQLAVNLLREAQVRVRAKPLSWRRS